MFVCALHLIVLRGRVGKGERVEGIIAYNYYRKISPPEKNTTVC